ncbi:hypothetical protein MferCBS49748_000124 [Microsporum ferrugineum]
MGSEHIREDPAIELQQNRDIKPDENNQQVKDEEQIVICQDANEPDYPHGIKLAVVIGSLAASVFLVALDETIITTAIPKITNDFHSINDIGWYGSA